MNYYPFHIGDYVSATRHLSWEEDAAFRRLLDTYYITEKLIPCDQRAACRLVMAQTDSQREAVRVVLAEFFELTPEGWTNKRADAEIAEMQRRQQMQREKANKRWHKPEPERGIATAQEPHAAASQTDAEAMPPTPTPTPVPKKKEKRASALVCPPDVAPQVWDDWVAHRRAKGSSVTETVLSGARVEAQKANLSLSDFLSAWCLNGTQGFKAEWIKPDQRVIRPPAWQQSRDKTIAGLIGSDRKEIVDVDATRVG